MSGILSAKARPLAKEVPTRRDPSSPGPRVKAIAERSSFVTPARLRAVSTTGRIFCWCALLASSGTTPPYSSCTFCEAMTLLRKMPSTITAAEVSSQLDSIANITTGLFIFHSKSGAKVHKISQLCKFICIYQKKVVNLCPICSNNSINHKN